jgi:hypothetical protein
MVYGGEKNQMTWTAVCYAEEPAFIFTQPIKRYAGSRTGGIGNRPDYLGTGLSLKPSLLFQRIMNILWSSNDNNLRAAPEY